MGMMIDARHGFMLSNGVGDFQKEEQYVPYCYAATVYSTSVHRYCNIDYIVASTLHHMSKFTPLVLSYDIACQ
jgi:hypothetical protein